MVQRHVLHLHALDFPGEDAGHKHHRIDQIVALFADDPDLQVSALSWWHESAISAALHADLLILHGLALPEIADILLARRTAGRVSVFELGDDPSTLTPWRSRPQRNPLYLEELYYLASLCDAVQVSSPGLAQRFAPLSQDIAVLPNAVEFPEQQPDKPTGFRLGWAGTRSHREDLQTIVPVLRDFISAHGDVVLALKGDTAMLRELFSSFPQGQLEIEPFGSYSDYRRFFASLHVGVIPLLNNPFNFGRTAVKLVEMVAEGVLPIVQDSAVYRDYASHLPLFANTSELSYLLGQFYNDPIRCREQANSARQILCVSHNLPAVRAQHRSSYLKNLVAYGLPMPTKDADADSRYFRLRKAMELLRLDSHKEAESVLAQLLAEKPDFAQARWMLSQLLFSRNERSAALSVSAPLQHCPPYSDLRRMLQARICPDERLNLLPGFRSRRWQLMTTSLTSGDALHQHRQRLEVHPFDYFALKVLEGASALPAEERQLVRERLSLFSEPQTDSN